MHICLLCLRDAIIFVILQFNVIQKVYGQLLSTCPQDVFVTYRVKQYASIFEPEAGQEDGEAPDDDYPQPDTDTSSVLAVLLCRSEAHIGIPELIINADFTYCTDLKHLFTSGDKKYVSYFSSSLYPSSFC